MKEINTFLQTLLRFIFTRNIPKCDAGILLDIGLGFALAYSHDSAATIHPSHEYTDDHHEQDERYQETQQRINNLADYGCLLFRELYIILCESLGQGGLVFRHRRVIRNASGLICLRVGLDFKRRILDCDSLDLLVFQHLEELVICYLPGCRCIQHP